MKLNDVKRAFFGPLVGAVPLSLLKWMSSCNLIVLYYHVVSDDPIPHIHNLYKYKNTSKFSKDLDLLLMHYSPIGLSDAIQWVRGDKVLPANSFLLTFDDGLRETCDVIAPILLGKGIPATIFISSAFLDNKELCYSHKISLLVERIRKGVLPGAESEIKRILVEMGLLGTRMWEEIGKIPYRQRETLDTIAELLDVDLKEYLNVKQPYLTSVNVRELIKKGFTIGTHSIDHPYYSDLSLEDQLLQTISSTKMIGQRFELNYGAFAFPHNDQGVSQKFFKEIQESGLIDISFGTGGMLNGALKTHKQRVSLEDPSLSAKEVLAWEYTRKIYNQLKGKNR